MYPRQISAEDEWGELTWWLSSWPLGRTSGVEGRSFISSLHALLRRLFALSACLDVGHWSRALRLIGSPEQTHQLTSSPSGRDASRRTLTIIWNHLFSAGFSDDISNKQASHVHMWITGSVSCCVFVFYVSVIILISCLTVCFSRPSSTSPGFFMLIIFHKRWHFPRISEYAGAECDKWLLRHEYHSFMPVSSPGEKQRVIN